MVNYNKSVSSVPFVIYNLQSWGGMFTLIDNVVLAGREYLGS